MRIGVFDSGIGGLTVLHELRRLCPGHSTVYLGDTARVPYGTKSPQTIARYCRANADFLLNEGIDFLVLACNTASAFALDSLASLPVPVVGVIEPGAEFAAGRTRSGKIGILGTAGTIRSGAYGAALKRCDPRITVDSIACGLFVPLVEEGWQESEIARLTARSYLEPWTQNPETSPDCVILGCTHYPLLKAMIQEVLGDKIELIDSAQAVARHVKSQLTQPAEPEPTHQLFLTDASDVFIRFARRLMEDLPEPSPQIELADLDQFADPLRK